MGIVNQYLASAMRTDWFSHEGEQLGLVLPIPLFSGCDVGTVGMGGVQLKTASAI